MKNIIKIVLFTAVVVVSFRGAYAQSEGACCSKKCTQLGIMKFPYKLIDLTHVVDGNTPTWDGGCGFHHELRCDYGDCKGDVKFRVQKLTMNAGVGTHMDSPSHCIEGARSIDQLLLRELVAECVVIDVSNKAHESYDVSVEDVKAFEGQYGKIPEGAFVMIKTGWERFWNEREKYRNDHKFPGVSKDAALMLLERGVCGLGIDTLSADRPESGFPVHQVLLGAGKYLVENAANLGELPCKGAFVMVLPIKIKGATEAPIRLIGLTEI